MEASLGSAPYRSRNPQESKGRKQEGKGRKQIANRAAGHKLHAGRPISTEAKIGPLQGVSLSVLGTLGTETSYKLPERKAGRLSRIEDWNGSDFSKAMLDNKR